MSSYNQSTRPALFVLPPRMHIPCIVLFHMGQEPNFKGMRLKNKEEKYLHFSKSLPSLECLSVRFQPKHQNRLYFEEYIYWNKEQLLKRRDTKTAFLTPWENILIVSCGRKLKHIERFLQMQKVLLVNRAFYFLYLYTNSLCCKWLVSNKHTVLLDYQK